MFNIYLQIEFSCNVFIILHNILIFNELRVFIIFRFAWNILASFLAFNIYYIK